MFRGSIPALVTPFANGEVDVAGVRKLVEHQIASGSHGLVAVGTTGESPTLSHQEHGRVIELVIEAADGRVPVIAGAGSNNTAESISLIRHAASVGAAAALVVTPYYNKPTQRGLIQHYTTLAETSAIPIIIYNIPGRSVIDMSVETMATLARHERIIGVKDATGNIARVSQQRAACGPDFMQLSGEDATALGFNAHGGVGCISVTANVAPKLCAEFQEATLAGDYARALELQDRLMPLHETLFIESNPCPAKYALSVLGICSDEVRSPLVTVTDETKTRVRAAMVHAGLIN